MEQTLIDRNLQQSTYTHLIWFEQEQQNMNSFEMSQLNSIRQKRRRLRGTDDNSL